MLKMRCNCGAPSKWLEMPPESPHAYEVVCSRCDKHAKWGSQAELNALADADIEGIIVSYDERTQAPSDPFTPFYEA